MVNKPDISTKETLTFTALGCSKYNPPPFEDEQRRREFIANVKSRCENILKHVQLFNHTTDVPGTREDLANSQNFCESLTPFPKLALTESKTREQTTQLIERHVENIKECVRITVMQKVS